MRLADTKTGGDLPLGTGRRPYQPHNLRRQFGMALAMFRTCAGQHVCGTYTGGVLTEVVKIDSIGDRSAMFGVDVAMGEGVSALISLTDSQSSVSEAIKTTMPYPAGSLVSEVDLIPSLLVRGRAMAVDIVQRLTFHMAGSRVRLAGDASRRATSALALSTRVRHGAVFLSSVALGGRRVDSAMAPFYRAVTA